MSRVERREKPAVDALDDVLEVAVLEFRCSRTAGEEGVAAEEKRFFFELEADGSRSVPGREDGAQFQIPDRNHHVILQQVVVAGKHPGIGRGDPHFVASISHFGNRSDVIPVAVGLEDSAHIERLAELEQALVFVCSIQEDGVASVLASDHKDVVVHRTHHEFVDFGVGVVPDQRVSHLRSLCPTRPARRAGRGVARPQLGPWSVLLSNRLCGRRRH